MRRTTYRPLIRRRGVPVAVAAAGAVGLGLTVGLGAGSGSASARSAGAVRAAAGAVRIHDIQGASHTSPLSGQAVTGVPGVVIARSGTGFWFQDPDPDMDPATSEGVFVFTKSKPAVAVGDSVRVDGTVAEFRPGGTSTTNLTTTEIDGPTVTVEAHDVTLPPPAVVRNTPHTVIEDDAFGTFDVKHDGLDYWESMEGMRVEIDDAQVVGPRTSFGEVPVVAGTAATVRTRRGGIVARDGDFNPERVIIDDALASIPSVDVGDSLPGRNVGVLDYSFGDPKLLLAATPKVTKGNLPPETTRAPKAGELAMATANVENLAPGDPASKYDGLAKEIVDHLSSPDLVNVEEVQDNDGATDDGTVAADQTVAKLVAAIKAAGGPSYEWRSIDPVNDQDGGEPGGNIRVGFLFRTDRGLSFVDRPGGTSTNATGVTADGGLTFSPGRIEPGDSAWQDSRKPLAGEFTWHGKRLIVVANHWNSKGGDDPLYGRYQPPSLPSETQRGAQAAIVASFVKSITAADPAARVIVAGDLNCFDFSSQVRTLTATGLVDLPSTLPLPERYTYDYEGNSEVLDHILLSPALAARPYDYDVVHVNAEYAVQASDHDPSVVRLSLG